MRKSRSIQKSSTRASVPGKKSTRAKASSKSKEPGAQKKSSAKAAKPSKRGSGNKLSQPKKNVKTKKVALKKSTGRKSAAKKSTSAKKSHVKKSTGTSVNTNKKAASKAAQVEPRRSTTQTTANKKSATKRAAAQAKPPKQNISKQAAKAADKVKHGQQSVPNSKSAATISDDTSHKNPKKSSTREAADHNLPLNKSRQPKATATPEKWIEHPEDPDLNNSDLSTKSEQILGQEETQSGQIAADVAESGPGTTSPQTTRGKAIETAALNMNVTFLNGIGQVTIKQFRNGRLIDQKRVTTSSDISFADAAAGDSLSLTGVCAGQAEIYTDRATDPAGVQDQPLKYEEAIQDILLVL